MKDGYWKEVQKLYYIQMSDLINSGYTADSPEYQEVLNAEYRMIDQIRRMCLEEHGSHDVYDNSPRGYCKRCGAWVD